MPGLGGISARRAAWTSDTATNSVLKFRRSRMPVTDGLRGDAFRVRETDPATGKFQPFATPLLLALMLV